MKFDINEKEVKVLIHISPITAVVVFCITLIIFYPIFFQKSFGTMDIFMMGCVFIGTPIFLLVLYIVFKNKSQDIALLKNGIEWPIASLSLSSHNARTVVPYSKVRKCFVGRGESKRSGMTYDYFHIEIEGSKWKYFIAHRYPDGLDIERIKDILNIKGVRFENGSYEKVRTLYFGELYS